MDLTGIKGVIFDKDGTLFDFERTWSHWAQAFLSQLADGDAAAAAKIGAAVGYDFAQERFAADSVVIAGTPGDIAQAMLGALPDRDPIALAEVMNACAAEAPQAEVVPLRPFLEALRRLDLRLGVATNDSIGPAMAHLEAAGIAECFDFIAGYDSGFGGKPAPGQLLAFCEQTELDPDDVIMVGDSTHDLRAGQAAGMRTVGVLTGMADRKALEPLADHVLPDIGGLTALLGPPSPNSDG